MTVPIPPERRATAPVERPAQIPAERGAVVPPDGRQRLRPQVEAGRLWPGGIMTAVVAGLVALVGVLCRSLFNITILAPRHDGAYGDVTTTGLVLAAAAAALVATALAHLLRMPGR